MSKPLDPLALLKALSPLLNMKGGVLGLEEMKRIVGLMKDASQLVSRCVYLNILRVTDVQELLEKFILEGGWTVLNTWLLEAKNSENMALVLEVLKILQQLPLKINHLKQNNTPKLVKSFVKNSSCSKVKSVAAALMTHWLAIIKDASVPSESTKKKNKSKPENKTDSTKKSSSKPPSISKAPSFSKFRKTGLESSSETSKKPVKPAKGTATKRSSVDNEPSISLPDKKPKPDPKPPKKITISTDFMEAISSVATTRRPVVKRKPVSKPKAASSNTNSNESSSPSHQSSSVSGEAGDFTGSPERQKTPSPVPSPVEPSKPRLNKHGKPMKSVKWLPDERLESIRYFEKEEGERVNVTTQSFKDALRRERNLERQKIGDFHHQGEGFWKKPKLISLPSALVVIGSSSVEKQIQEEREKSVLQEIFLCLEMVPDSPAEPDPEPYELIPPKIIPIEDPNDPGPLSSRSPSPQESDLGDVSPKVEEDNPDLLKDKLREIIQTATALNQNNIPNSEEPSPTTPQEMYYPPMVVNGDPNFQYQTSAPMMQGPNNFYPNDPNLPPMGPEMHQQGMMMAPHMVPPGDQFHPNWRPMMSHHRPHHMEPPRHGGMRPHMPPRFPRGYRGNGPWRPREPWRGQAPGIPGAWQPESRRFAR